LDVPKSGVAFNAAAAKTSKVKGGGGIIGTYDTYIYLAL
jgi:hypothetical protein